MADQVEVLDAVTTLVHAGLSFAPKREDLASVAQAWARALRYIPGDLLATAVDDWIMEKAEFPKPAQIIELAHRIKANNNQSIAGGWFKPGREYEDRPEPGGVPGVYVLAAEGWRKWQPGDGPRIDWQALERESAEIDQAHPPTFPERITTWADLIAYREAQHVSGNR